MTTRLAITNFSKAALSSQNSATIKGGTNFCDWYLNLCGGSPHPALMQKMMEWDAQIGNIFANPSKFQEALQQYSEYH